MKNFNWVPENSSFVLYREGEPTEIKVSFNKGIWEIEDEGTILPQRYFDTPSEAMKLVNEIHRFDASYDEYEGLALVVDSIKKDIDGNFDLVDDSLTTIRNNLNQLVSIYQGDELFNEVSLLIDDFLLETFKMSKNMKNRLDGLIRSTENRRGNNK